MDIKDNSIVANYNHSISINDRKNILITGVKKIDSFDDEEFLVETVMGYLVIKGEELGLIKLDTLQGNVTIKGLLKSFSYVDELAKKEKEGSIFNRLFK
jgi:sporulation protein YabP